MVRKWPPKYKRRFRQPFRNAPNDSNHTHETRLHQVVGNFYDIGDSGRMGMGVVKSSIIRLLYYLTTQLRQVIRCNRGDFVGSWAAEFALDSVLYS